MKVADNQVVEETRACINTKNNDLFLSVYTVNPENNQMTGEEETLFLWPDKTGYYKVVSKLHGQANVSYLGADHNNTYHYRPVIDYSKMELNPDDLKKIEENKAMLDTVEGKKPQQMEEYMYQKIAELEKSGVKVQRLTS